MKLKKLIVTGFKSFADKVTLSFGDGITGIVGPNGSGKSNVIDSVRWVMGEQSVKHLRGSVATDIIFAGSAKRKALGMAEVTLVFDNSIYSDICPPEFRNDPEISIGRRLYIDGEREYFINRKPCRLKDILSFISLTGLGGRSYSMIQQGQVDRILNSKPEDVRLILEEAAGTIIFKQRKQGAEKKLETTRENLSRIDDILVEIKRQLDSLEGQVKKAKSFNALNLELKQTDLIALGHSYVDLKRKFDELHSNFEQNQDQEVELATSISQLESSVVLLQNQLQEADPELEELRERVATVREAIVRSESKITAAFVKIESGEQRLEQINADYAKDDDSINQIKRDQEDVIRQLDILKDQKTQLQEELENLAFNLEEQEESALVFSSKEDQIKADLRNLELLLETNSLRSEAIERDRKRSQSEVLQSQEKLSILEKSNLELLQKIQLIQSNVDAHQLNLDEMINQKTALDRDTKRQQAAITTLKEVLASAKQSLITIDAKITSTEDFLATSRGIAEAFQAMKTHSPEVAEWTIDIIANMIQLTSEGSAELPAAFIAAFDAWSERIIVEKHEHISKLSELAVTLKLPRLPLSIVEYDKNVKIEEISNWSNKYHARPLLSFIKITKPDSRLESILKRLYYTDRSLSLGSVSEIPVGCTLFSANGVIVQSPTDLVIESKSHKGTISRQAELRSLQNESEALSKDLQKIDSELANATAQYNETLSELSKTDQSISSKNSELLEDIKNLQLSKNDYEFKKSLANDAKQQLTHHQNSLELFTKELENLGEARISLGKERENLSFEVTDLEENSQDIKEQAEEARRMYDAKKISVTQINAQCEAKSSSIAQYDRQIAMMEESYHKRRSELARISEEIALAKTEELEIAEEIQNKIAERESLEVELNVRRQANSDLVTKIRKAEEDLKEARNNQAKLLKQKSTKQLEKERISMALEGIAEQAFDRYQMDISTYEFKFDPEFDTTATSKRVQKIRSEIEALGAINMMAIEEFDKLQTRYEFINEQKQEVLDSILLLEDAISEIAETAKSRFLETFEVIDKNFAELFPVLFPGGDARLHLINPDDPLNGGVDILVRLPGKKQGSMMAFSGGEKALTAISLIFALLKTKPTPFCFLDEVDAPLDEANVGRYNAVLEHLSSRFQFVVITHNRRTMEVLDQLYGVTMQEGGVSKVVGVDLKKSLPSHLQKVKNQPEAASVQN